MRPSNPFPRRSGFLHKKGRLNPAFQSRWFTLADGEMQYFKKAPGVAEESSPQGKIALLPDSTVTAKYFEKFPYGFVISLNGAYHRTFLLAAPTYEERLDWMGDIKQSIETLRQASVKHNESLTTYTTNDKVTSNGVVEETSSTSAVPHIAGTTGSLNYQTLSDDALGDFGQSLNPLTRIALFFSIVIITLLLFILLTAFVTWMVVIILVVLLCIYVAFGFSHIRSAICSWLLLNQLDSLGQAHSINQKSAQQCQAEIVEAFNKRSKMLSNSDVMNVFHKLRLYTKQGTKWQFVRQEQSNSVWAVITGGYGKTSTYRHIIKCLQDQAIANYNRAHRKSLITLSAEDQFEEMDWSSMADAENIKPLLQYNPTRIPVAALADRTDELVDQV